MCELTDHYLLMLMNSLNVIKSHSDSTTSPSLTDTGTINSSLSHQDIQQVILLSKQIKRCYNILKNILTYSMKDFTEIASIYQFLSKLLEKITTMIQTSMPSTPLALSLSYGFFSFAVLVVFLMILFRYFVFTLLCFC